MSSYKHFWEFLCFVLLLVYNLEKGLINSIDQHTQKWFIQAKLQNLILESFVPYKLGEPGGKTYYWCHFLWDQTHQTDTKKTAFKKSNCRSIAHSLGLNQEVSLYAPQKAAIHGIPPDILQLQQWNKQVATVCTCHSKKESGRSRIFTPHTKTTSHYYSWSQVALSYVCETLLSYQRSQLHGKSLTWAKNGGNMWETPHKPTVFCCCCRCC